MAIPIVDEIRNDSSDSNENEENSTIADNEESVVDENSSQEIQNINMEDLDSLFSSQKIA